jgi:FAD synthase
VKRRTPFKVHGPITPKPESKTLTIGSFKSVDRGHKRIRSDNFVLTSHFKTPKANGPISKKRLRTSKS